MPFLLFLVTGAMAPANAQISLCNVPPRASLIALLSRSGNIPFMEVAPDLLPACMDWTRLARRLQLMPCVRYSS